MSRLEQAVKVPAASRRYSLLQLVCVVTGLLSTLAVCCSIEWQRLQAAIKSPIGAFGWFANWHLDSTLPFLLLIALLLIFGVVVWQQSLSSIITRYRTPLDLPKTTHRNSRYAVATIGLFLLSFLSSASIGMREVKIGRSTLLPDRPSSVRFFRLPPAYHDEYSYLLQARTFLSGRVAWPGMNVRPDLFHQMHVVNEPTTASRYFPWTGLWLAPFVAAGNPFFGQWVAGALSCVFFFRSLLRTLPVRWAVIGGLLIAVSPGIAVFGNLLLAHHATMLALSIFLWSFLRLMESAGVRDAFIAGAALTCAMLGRPMTAAGFALPFGIWLITQVFRPVLRPTQIDGVQYFQFRVLLTMGLPLMVGFSVLATMNHEITGRWNLSAYQHYTNTWTPRHRFGFHNVEIGSQLAGPKTLVAYDRWARDLTPAVAAENLQNRIIASSQWTLGITMLLFALISGLPNCLPATGGDTRIGLILASIISLHVVHLPYWYDGIMHWHYVFETAPLLLMLAAVGLRNIYEAMQPLRCRRLVPVWLTTFVIASLLPNWVDANSFWGISRVSAAFSEQCFSRIRFEEFHRLVNASSVAHPCLVLVDERSSDPQLSYIINPPDLSGDVLVCRHPETDKEVTELQRLFPDRTIYKFDPDSFVLSR